MLYIDICSSQIYFQSNFEEKHSIRLSLMLVLKNIFLIYIYKFNNYNRLFWQVYQFLWWKQVVVKKNYDSYVSHLFLTPRFCCCLTGWRQTAAWGELWEFNGGILCGFYSLPAHIIQEDVSFSQQQYSLFQFLKLFPKNQQMFSKGVFHW